MHRLMCHVGNQTCNVNGSLDIHQIIHMTWTVQFWRVKPDRFSSEGPGEFLYADFGSFCKTPYYIPSKVLLYSTFLAGPGVYFVFSYAVNCYQHFPKGLLERPQNQRIWSEIRSKQTWRSVHPAKWYSSTLSYSFISWIDIPFLKQTTGQDGGRMWGSDE